MGHGRAFFLGLAVAVLSSALPYFLELAAIKRVRASTYGVLLSIEPAIAALDGVPDPVAAPGLSRDRSHSRHRRGRGRRKLGCQFKEWRSPDGVTFASKGPRGAL